MVKTNRSFNNPVVVVDAVVVDGDGGDGGDMVVAVFKCSSNWWSCCGCFRFHS